MKEFRGFLLAGLLMAASSLSFALEQSELVGYWKGNLVKNFKDASAGGNAAKGDTSTPIDMMFMTTKAGLAGYGRVGSDNIEVWVLEGDEFRWTEGSFEVVAKRVSDGKSLPSWIASELPPKSKSIANYAIQSCIRFADQKPCEGGKDVPKGLDDSAVFSLWLDKKNHLNFGAFYAYDKAQTKHRILKWSGSKQKKAH